MPFHPAQSRTLWWYLLAAALLGTLAYAGATWARAGHSQGWPAWERHTGAVALAFLAWVALGGLVAFLFALIGDDAVAASVFRYALIVASGGCAYLALAFLLYDTTGYPVKRTVLIGIGASLGLFTVLKPSWFWEDDRASFLRQRIGDTATSAVYYLIALGFVALGLRGPSFQLEPTRHPVDGGLIAAVALAALVNLMIRRSAARAATHGLPPRIREAMAPAETDQAAADALLDAHFTGVAEKEKQERSALWERARTDPAAAAELRSRLLDDFARDAEALREFRKDGPPELIAEIEGLQKATRAALARLDDLTRRSGSR